MSDESEPEVEIEDDATEEEESATTPSYVRALPVKLTQDELAEKLHQAQELLELSTDLDGEAAALKMQAKAKIEESDQAMRKVRMLVGQCDAGEEVRDVPCYREEDIAANIIRIRRVDTEAIVEERAMTQQEREELAQMSLLPVESVQ